MKWFRNKIMTLMIALSNVEKGMLSQNTDDTNTSFNQSKESESLTYALKHGVINKELKLLRWRMYKVLEYLGNKDITITTKDGIATYEAKEKNYKHKLKKVKLDEHDDLELVMVIDNLSISTAGYLETLHDMVLKSTASSEEKKESESIGEISLLDYTAHVKSNRKIEIERSHIPKFKLEKYTKKLNVLKVEDDKYLLEFYASLYPDEYDTQHKLFINQIQQAITNPRASSILDFDAVTFVTHNDLGVMDCRLFRFENVTYDKIITFDGNYVIKFKCKSKIYGHSIIEQYRDEDLDNKYENKESKELTAAFTFDAQ